MPLLALILALGVAQAELPSQPVVVDRIVAVVGDRLITASDLALERILAQRDPSPVAMLEHRRADPEEFLIDLAIVRGMAGQISVYEPSTEEVSARLSHLRETWEDTHAFDDFLVAQGLDTDRLEGALYSRMVVERYVQRNVGLPAEAAGDTPEQAEARYDAWMAERRAAVTIRMVTPGSP